MNKTILLLTALIIAGSTMAQNCRKMQVGLGFGPYGQNNTLGSNAFLSLDYRINSSYTLSQSSQFGFIAIPARGMNYKVPAVNKHFSVVLMRDVYKRNRLNVFMGAGLAYTSYNELYRIRYDMNELRTASQLSFPIHLEINHAVSNSVLIGFRIGGQVPTHSRLFNYTFINPVVKFRL